MKRMQAWWILAILGALLLVATAGCTAKGKVSGNDDDNNDDSDNNDNPISGSANARGSPGWGLIGALGGLGAVAIVMRKLA